MQYKKLILAGVFALAAAACGPGDGPQPASQSFGQTQQTTLNPGGPFLTSPVWLPDAGGITARGYRGEGIYLIRKSGAEPRIIHPDYKGYLEWIEEGRSFCLKDSGLFLTYTFDDASGGFVASMDSDIPCYPRPGAIITERPLFEKHGPSIRHDLYTGNITIYENGEQLKIVDSNTWGATASPDGSRIAFSKGHTAGAALHVYESGAGLTTIGPGVHPSWCPDGKFLVYARPNQQGTGPDPGAVTHSDLFIVDMETGISTRLTDTPDMIEMQPNVSPSGGEIAFSDWKSGAIGVIPRAVEVAP
ncbi:MAG: hypothetical protein ABIJ56_10185 [Pseudomonadota bacterium]